jgi:thioredoxin-like negative regulator of GroEL
VRGERPAIKDLEARVATPGKLPPPLLARALATLARVPGIPADKAKELAQAAVKAWGASGEAHLVLGEQLTGAGRTTELVEAKSLDPARPEARVALAEALFSTGDRAQAFAEASSALRITPSGPLAERARAVINGGDSGKHRPAR